MTNTGCGWSQGIASINLEQEHISPAPLPQSRRISSPLSSRNRLRKLRCDKQRIAKIKTVLSAASVLTRVLDLKLLLGYPIGNPGLTQIVAAALKKVHTQITGTGVYHPVINAHRDLLSMHAFFQHASMCTPHCPCAFAS